MFVHFYGALLWTLLGFQNPVDTTAAKTMLETLTSDAMEGREWNQQGGEKAADYIALQMEKAGLKPYSGYDSFKIPVDLYAIEYGQPQVKLNGQDLKQEDAAVFCNCEQVNTNGPFKTYYVPQDGDLRATYGALPDQGTHVIAVHPSHRNLLSRYWAYIAKNRNVTEALNGDALIFVVTEANQIDTLSVTVKNKVEKMHGFNVVGQVTGTSRPSEKVVLSAHYDHIGMLPADKEGKDRVFNGADDNASGTVAILLLAQYYADNPPARSVVVIAFTAEEPGLLGSKHFVAKHDVTDFVGGLNFEMVGKASKFGAQRGFMTGWDRSPFPQAFVQALAGSAYQLHPDPYPQLNLFTRSDNFPFVTKGIVVHTLSSAEVDKDPNYHGVGDEFETLNLDHFAAMVQMAAIGLQPLVSGALTPQLKPAP